MGENKNENEMENRTFNILIVEDLPLLNDVYKMYFKSLMEENEHWKFNIKDGNTCDRVLYVLKNQTPSEGFDLVISDYKLTPSADGKYLSGEDIALYIREKFPRTPILFNADVEKPIILGLLKNIKPEGILLKTESTAEILMRAVIEILQGGSYYGKSVLQIMRLPFETDLILDEWDRKLLYELNRGTNTTHIPNILPLSLSSVARRKRRLKEIFEVEGEADRELLDKARALGFL